MPWTPVPVLYLPLSACRVLYTMKNLAPQLLLPRGRCYYTCALLYRRDAYRLPHGRHVGYCTRVILVHYGTDDTCTTVHVRHATTDRNTRALPTRGHARPLVHSADRRITNLCAHRSLCYSTRARWLHVGTPAHMCTVYGRSVLNLRARAGRYTTYTMRNKSEAFAKYKLFEKFAETHTGRKVKILRTDRGGEYLSTEFKSYLDANGTQHQLTTAYTPQQNGVAERLNRTLIDLVRSILSHKQVNMQFWAEALATSVYVRNQVTSRALPVNTTPHHTRMGATPTIGHLRVFGSKCWYTLPKLELCNLDHRAREAMFLGYAQGSKAYKFWDGELSKVILSRDVKFDESNCGTHDAPTNLNDFIHDDNEVVMLGDDNEDEQNEADHVAEVENEESDVEALDDTEGNDDTQTLSGDDDADDPISNTKNENNLSTSPTPAVRRSSPVRKPPGSWWRKNFAAAFLSHAHVAIEGRNSFKEATSNGRSAGQREEGWTKVGGR